MALIDKETIRKEIERRKKEHLETAVSSPIYGAKFAEDCEILAFLDTLPEQKETAEDDYCEEVFLCGKHFG